MLDMKRRNGDDVGGQFLAAETADIVADMVFAPSSAEAVRS